MGGRATLIYGVCSYARRRACQGSRHSPRPGNGGVIPAVAGFLKVAVTPPAKLDSFPPLPLSRDELPRTFTLHKRPAVNDSRFTTRI